MALPTIRQLEYFVTAARVGTFAGAAAEHFIAQPSLSEQISTLEQSLGVVLFTRTSRRLLLTDAGKQLLPLTQRTLASARELSEHGKRLRTLEEGTVSFGTFSSAHLYLLTDLIRDFHNLYPSVRIRVTGLNSSDVADAVRAGDIEAGLVQLPIDDSELDVTPSIFSDQVVYVSNNPEHTAKPVDVATMANYPLILSEARWANADPLRVSLARLAQQEGISLQPLIEVEFQIHVLDLAAEGVGNSLVSYHVGRPLLAQRGLTWAPLDPPIIEHYAFITRHNGAISPATAQFMRLAGQALQRLAKHVVPPEIAT
ncbi:MAG: LysR family transcriptional regulator [Microbacteriaceae bacterium]|nr:MAG: LysR family transcriptional regulator [Microbacteriaceae bacterium]